MVFTFYALTSQQLKEARNRSVQYFESENALQQHINLLFASITSTLSEIGQQLCDYVIGRELDLTQVRGDVGTLNGRKGLFTDHFILGRLGHVGNNQFLSATLPSTSSISTFTAQSQSFLKQKTSSNTSRGITLRQIWVCGIKMKRRTTATGKYYCCSPYFLPLLLICLFFLHRSLAVETRSGEWYSLQD